MWQWIKNFINKYITKKEREILAKRINYSKMTKGDLKKLKAEGKIKDIYPPYIQSCNFLFLIYRFVMSLKMVLITALEEKLEALQAFKI